LAASHEDADISVARSAKTSAKPSFLSRLKLLWKTWMAPCAEC